MAGLGPHHVAYWARTRRSPGGRRSKGREIPERSRATVVSTLVQLISPGEAPLRQETDARDARIQALDRSLVRRPLVDGFDGQPNTLLIGQAQLVDGLQYAICVAASI